MVHCSEARPAKFDHLFFQRAISKGFSGTFSPAIKIVMCDNMQMYGHVCQGAKKTISNQLFNRTQHAAMECTMSYIRNRFVIPRMFETVKPICVDKFFKEMLGVCAVLGGNIDGFKYFLPLPEDPQNYCLRKFLEDCNTLRSKKMPTL